MTELMVGHIHVSKAKPARDDQDGECCYVWRCHGKIVTPGVNDQTLGTGAREHYDSIVDGP